MDAIAWATSAMIAARERVTVAAGNLANVSTSAFQRRVATGSLGERGVVLRTSIGEQRGALQRTGRPLDLAIVGAGAFQVMDANGHLVSTRGGSFERTPEGKLVDMQGRVLFGTCGAVILPEGASIEADGNVRSGGAIHNHLALPAGSRVQTGFIETSAVNAIDEMVAMLAAQRSYESAQKVVTAIDGVRQKSSSDVARLK